MALQSAYKQFLAAPNSSALASDASLLYVTTTTSFNSATNIIKHFSTLRNQINKKKEDFISVVEGKDAIAAELDTTIEFVTSGGSYVPGLDDNFLADRTVNIPITHIVTFDPSGKILQIRLTWDQGALLKELEVIGKTGRNWPIRDSKEQVRMITSAAKTTGPSSSGGTEDVVIRSRGSSTSTTRRDPHGSRFRDNTDNGPETVISPRAGSRSRPRQRSFAEILGDEPLQEEGASDPARGRSQSPSKVVAPKGGAGKNFQPSRLFENDESAEHDAPPTPDAKSPERFYKPNPKKYDHFDFADGSDPQDAPQPGEEWETKNKTKHASQWSFGDFVTPQKPQPSKTLRHQDVRHWGTENDEVQETPARKPNQPKPRRDAETHFEFVDDGLPQGGPRPAGRPKGTTHNNNLGLYKNNLYNEDGSAPTPGPEPRALGNITNLKDRSKDFGPHFEMTDDSPSQGDAPAQQARGVNPKAVQIMDAHWGQYDDESPSQKENNRKIYHTAGDGMGGKKANGRGWSIGDDSDEEAPERAPVPGRKQGTTKQTTKSSFWDF